MDSIFYRASLTILIFLLIAINPIRIFAEDSVPPKLAPTPVAEVVHLNSFGEKGIGKFLSKTMKTVSHKKHPSQYEKAYPRDVKLTLAPRLFDPQRKESPIRTARLFKIQITPAAISAEPVATLVGE